MGRPRGIISKPPPKPRKNFPLYAHRCGSWACKVGGELKTFGGWKNDPRGEVAYLAWKQFDEQRQKGGSTIQTIRFGRLTVQDIINVFLDDRGAKVSAGELDPSSYADYRRATGSFGSIVGMSKGPHDLGPDDFRLVRDTWAATRGPHSLGRWIQLIRTMFRHVGPDHGSGLMDKPPQYGGQFSKPAAKLKRKAIRLAETESGKRVFSAKEIAATLKACILLGLNCGFLSIDCARITARDVDLKSNWLEMVREKTENHRAAVLWPETVKALKAAIASRPDPHDEANAKLLMLTREGYPLVHDIIERDEDGDILRVSRSDSLNQAMRDLLDSISKKNKGIKRRKGVSFSALRKTFRTFADELGDANAASLVMGHAFAGMAQLYVRAIAEPRLKRISAHVRNQTLNLCSGFSPSALPSLAPLAAGRRKAGSAKSRAPTENKRGKSDARPRRR